MSPSPSSLEPNCTAFTRQVLSRVGDKWSILIIAHLGAAPMRFNALKRTIGNVSQRMLTLTLKGLERDGLVSRRSFPSVPPRVEYALTPLGHTLLPAVMTIIDWSHSHEADVEAARRAYRARRADRGARAT